QVHDEQLTGIEFEDQVLPPPLDAADLHPSESRDELLLGLTPHGARAADLDGLDALPDGLTLEAPPDGFDLWQFRHVRHPRPARCATAPTRLAPLRPRPASSSGPRPDP